VHSVRKKGGNKYSTYITAIKLLAGILPSLVIGIPSNQYNFA